MGSIILLFNYNIRRKSIRLLCVEIMGTCAMNVECVAVISSPIYTSERFRIVIMIRDMTIDISYINHLNKNIHWNRNRMMILSFYVLMKGAVPALVRSLPLHL